jgi:hypothetical protein
MGFNYDALTSAFGGKTFTAADQVAFDMARNFLNQGITDYSQIGKIPQYTPVQEIKTYNGSTVYTDENGQQYANVFSGQYDGEGGQIYQQVTIPPGTQLQSRYFIPGDEYTSDQVIDPSKVTIKNGQPVTQTGTTVGNKETGQAINQQFGYTSAGKGGTEYYVDPDSGKVYTKGISSSDLTPALSLVISAGANFLMPGVGAVIAQHLGVSTVVGTAIANAGFQVAMGADPKNILVSSLLGPAGLNVAGEISKFASTQLTDLISDPAILKLDRKSVV